MDRSSAAAFCAAWLPAWTGNHPEALLAFYAEEAFYRDPARPEGLRGRDELARYLRRLLAANPAWVWEAVELFPHDTGFCLKWRATIPARGTTVVEHGLDIVEVQDGKITRNEVYFDRTALLRATAEGASR